MCLKCRQLKSNLVPHVQAPWRHLRAIKPHKDRQMVLFRINPTSGLSEQALPPCGHERPGDSVHYRSTPFVQGALETGSKRYLAWLTGLTKPFFPAHRRLQWLAVAHCLTKRKSQNWNTVLFRHEQFFPSYYIFHWFCTDTYIYSTNIDWLSTKSEEFFWTLEIPMGKIDAITALTVLAILWVLDGCMDGWMDRWMNGQTDRHNSHGLRLLTMKNRSRFIPNPPYQCGKGGTKPWSYHYAFVDHRSSVILKHQEAKAPHGSGGKIGGALGSNVKDSHPALWPVQVT